MDAVDAGARPAACAPAACRYRRPRTRPTHHAASRRLWVAAERLPLLQRLFGDVLMTPAIVAPEEYARQTWTRETALQEIIRSRLGALGPVTVADFTGTLGLARADVESASGAAGGRRRRDERTVHARSAAAGVVRPCAAGAYPSLYGRPSEAGNRARVDAGVHAFPVSLATRGAE